MSRMRWGRALAAGAMVWGLAGCGGEDGEPDPFLGIFEVTGHSLSEMGCDTPNPLVDPSSCFGCAVETPFFKIKRQSLFGQSFLSLVGCESAAVCDDAEDPDTIDLTGAIFEGKEGGVWVGRAYASAYGGATCSFTQVEWELGEYAGGIALTRTTLRNTPESPSGMLDEEGCDALVDSPPPRDELTCDALETVLADAVD